MFVAFRMGYVVGGFEDEPIGHKSALKAHRSLAGTVRCACTVASFEVYLFAMQDVRERPLLGAINSARRAEGLPPLERLTVASFRALLKGTAAPGGAPWRAAGKKRAQLIYDAR